MLHAIVLRQFPGGSFIGEVVAVDADPYSGERAYHVRYADGDEEHLTAAQVQQGTPTPRVAKFAHPCSGTAGCSEGREVPLTGWETYLVAGNLLVGGSVPLSTLDQPLQGAMVICVL